MPAPASLCHFIFTALTPLHRSLCQLMEAALTFYNNWPLSLHWLSSLTGTHRDHLRGPFQPTLGNGNGAESDSEVEVRLLRTHRHRRWYFPFANVKMSQVVSERVTAGS